MKRFITVITVLLLTLIPGNLPASAQSQESAGQAAGQPAPKQDSIEISLLTCTPGTEIWSEFGHTALRIHNLTRGVDAVVNYGMFSSNTPYFIPKFVFGLTDYQVGVEPFNTFLAEYIYEGRGIIEQRLNISYADKVAICEAITENVKPENQVYRYNFFYDNCTTRARDIVVDNLSGKVKYPPAMQDSCSFRQMVHRCTVDYPWTQFGEDLLLGIQADWQTSKSEQQFLPDNLRKDFDKALYNGRPLVSSTRMIVTPQPLSKGKNVPLSPMDVMMILLVVTVTLELFEHKSKKIFWGIDLFYMLLTGLTGIVITAMIFSQHPTVRVNLLILILNPLPLIFGYQAIRHTIKHEKYWWWTAWEVLIVLFMVGGFFQTYPSGIIVLALVLLTRPLMHHYMLNKNKGVTPQK